VAVCDAVNHFDVRSSIKWPNDVLIAGRKVAGILTETSTRGERLEAAVVGIGVNANTTTFPEELAAIATSIARERSAPVDRAALLDALLDELERRVVEFVDGGAAPIVRAWKERTEILGKRLRVSVDGKLVEGVVLDVDDEGALWLDADGRKLRVLSGEVVA
jgi:BirA family biotin operon repressor/biotin-[acetyl-CoA-carboxylase] ligase